jgi:hypothetical protein
MKKQQKQRPSFSFFRLVLIHLKKSKVLVEKWVLQLIMANFIIFHLDKVNYLLFDFIIRIWSILGQDVVAEKALDDGSRDGNWVVLQNIHLVARWLPQLEKKLEQTAEVAHEEFRVFLSAEPAPDPEAHVNHFLIIITQFHCVFL